MRHFKPMIFLAAAVIMLFSAVPAPAESTLVSLWQSGCDLLFETDNVTVDGTAEFALDGTVFKTAQIHYVQDGLSSYYGLKLLTPRKDGTERETGWTIIADADGFYTVMETFYPGTYVQGHDTAYGTLLRRSVQLDALTELGGYLVRQLEPMLPGDAVRPEEKDGAACVRIVLKAGDLPDAAVSALNVAARYLSDRWFSHSHDREYYGDDVPFEDYITVTQALTDGTVKWTLSDADISIAIDDLGRFTAVGGTVTVGSVYLDSTVRRVDVRFDCTMTDYGESHVAPFDPADHGVLPQPAAYTEENQIPEISMDSGAWDDMKARADDLLLTEGYAVQAGAGWGGWLSGDRAVIDIDYPGELFRLSFTLNGSLTSLEHMTGDWSSADESNEIGTDPETLAAADAYMRAFIAKADPGTLDRIGVLEVQTAILTDGGRYLKVHDSGDNAHFVLRVEPSLRVEYYFSDYPGVHDAAPAD